MFVLGALAPSGSSGGLEIDLDLTVAPKPFVSAGSSTLASASFVNQSEGGLRDVAISFVVPAGSFESASPERCAVSSATRVTCEIGTLAAGGSVQQFVRFTAPAGEDEVAVGSTATYRKARQAAGTVLTRSDSDSTGVAPAGDPDLVGTCASTAGTLATDPTSGEANPQSTSVAFTDSAALPCTPVSVGEQERTPGNPGCPSGESCTTQVSFVTIPALPEPAIVTISFEREVLAPGTKPKNFVLWETPDKYPAQPIRRVQACPLPAGEDSCIVKVSKYRKKGIQVVLQVIGTGEDPRYAG
ncbi:MAG: hypothetical protein ACRDNG_11570 [Gaiellaceae bacterium]